MVQLYLVRHAIAEERGPKWTDDTKRPLTKAGIKRMRTAARGVSRLGITFDIVLTSPLVRARQTADVLAAAFDVKPPIVITHSLAPGSRFADLLADIKKQPKRECIALVGHEPDLGVTASRLGGLKRPLEFKKGAVCRIDVDSIPPSGAGVLRWFATPALLRSIGR